MELQRPPALTHRKHRRGEKGGGAGDVQSAEERKRKNMAQKKFKCSSWKISDPATTSPHDISESATHLRARSQAPISFSDYLTFN